MPGPAGGVLRLGPAPPVVDTPPSPATPAAAGSMIITGVPPGYEADVLLLARNPLTRIENSRSIVAVIVDGERVSNVVSADQAGEAP